MAKHKATRKQGIRGLGKVVRSKKRLGNKLERSIVANILNRDRSVNVKKAAKSEALDKLNVSKISRNIKEGAKSVFGDEHKFNKMKERVGNLKRGDLKAFKKEADKILSKTGSDDPGNRKINKPDRAKAVKNVEKEFKARKAKRIPGSRLSLSDRRLLDSAPSGEETAKSARIRRRKTRNAKSRNTMFLQSGEKYRRSNVPKDSDAVTRKLAKIKGARSFNTGKSLLSKAVSSVVRFAGPAGVALSAITSSKPLNVGEAEFLENEKRKVHRARKRR